MTAKHKKRKTSYIESKSLVKKPKKPLDKALEAFFYAVLAIVSGFYLYMLFNSEKPDQSAYIDKTITYTTTVTSTIPLDFTPSPQEVVESIPDYVSVPEGGLDWKIFAGTKSIPYTFTDEGGHQKQGVKPEFAEALQKLDGQIVLMQGYMFPLGAEEGQSMFLFGPFPVGCPFHYHVGPALVIEAHAKEKLKIHWDAVNIEGRLELVTRDDNYNVFYRLHDAILK